MSFYMVCLKDCAPFKDPSKLSRIDIKNAFPIAQCDEMKNFGINSNFMTNRVVWAPIDREKSNFKKIMSG